MTLLWALIAAASVAGGFDHVIHEGRATGSGGAMPACTDCHDVRATGALRGAPDHATCFGRCHGDPPARARRNKPYPIEDAARRLCLACHAPAELSRLEKGEIRTVRASYPPYSVDPDFALTVPHSAHAAASCTDCHDVPGSRPRRRRPHDRCASCHARPAEARVPAMTACTACHRSAFGPAVGPTMERGAFAIAGAFDHPRHARAAPKATCVSCHEAVTREAGDVLPSPKMAACATCHDGERAFSTTAARCRSCHGQAGNARPAHRDRPSFSHRTHAAIAGDESVPLPCTDCHRLDAEGRPLAPGADHRPCADAGCHAEEFASPEPRICGTCHVGSEPWRPLRWFPPPRRASEFGARYSHAGHAEAERPCAFCHAGAAARRPVSGGHSSCRGDACHDVGTGSPALSECSSCHERGLLAGREHEAAARRWSVRVRFRHDAHASPCTDCHTEIESSSSLADIAPPTKQRCAGCHDGDSAFKMTGHACARCHARNREGDAAARALGPAPKTTGPSTL